MQFSTVPQLLHGTLCLQNAQANGAERGRISVQNKCVAENGSGVETRPGIAESFAPALSGFTSDMQSELQGAQKENRPPLSQGRPYFRHRFLHPRLCIDQTVLPMAEHAD